MKKMIRANTLNPEIFSEEFKDETYMSLGKSNPDWDKFFEKNLQPYCNDVLEEFNIWSELDFTKIPRKVIFYDLDDDTIITVENFRSYGDEITDIWLDVKSRGPESFKNQLRKIYGNMFKEV